MGKCNSYACRREKEELRASLGTIPQPDGLSMSDGEITLFYANLDEASAAFDKIEALSARKT